MRKPIRFLIQQLFLASALLLFPGCLHHRLDATYSGPKHRIEALISVPPNLACQEKVVVKAAGYTRKEIRF